MNGASQKGDFLTGSKIFDKAKNEALYTLANKWGFTANYTGPNTPISGITRSGGHDNHGHFGFGGLKITELRNNYQPRSAPEVPKNLLLPSYKIFQIRP